MNEPPQSASGVDLAKAKDFRLGRLLVCPSGGVVRLGEREERVEPRVMQVLVVLAGAAGQTVSREELIAACWGGRFVSDDAVARAVAQVRSLARGVDPAPFMLETIPKVGFRLRAQPGASERSGLEARASTGVFAAGTLRIYLGASALALVLGVSLAVLLLWPGRGGEQTGRVEVMRFHPIQRDAALQRYSTVVADAIVRMLVSKGVQTPEAPLERGSASDADRAELRVTGTVDRDGGKYVVNAQVISRRSGIVLWSARFDRDAAAPVGFQEEAANRIADTLYCALWHRSADRKPVSEHVFQLLLAVCAAWRGESTELLAPADQLVEAAPDDSYAHSIRALGLAVADLEDPGGLTSRRRAVEREAQRALQLDPRNAEAYQALAMRYHRRGHWLEREQAYLRGAGLGRTPPTFFNMYVPMLREVGRWRDAAAVNRRTVALDPFSPYQLGNSAIMQAALGNDRDAEQLVEAAERLNPKEGRELRATIAFWWAAPAVAMAKLKDYGGALDRRDHGCLQSYLAQLTRARAPLRGLPSSCAEAQLDYRIRMLAREGDLDGAYDAFESARDPAFVTTMLYYPEMKAFRRDPRFIPLVARLGLAEYWMKSNHLPDFCYEPDLPYDCKAELSRSLRARM